MRDPKTELSSSERWAQFRFGVVGLLLSSPPARGDLQRALLKLAQRTWQHPLTGKPVQYGVATIERWYYRSLKETGSIVQALQRRVRFDAGRSRAVDECVKAILAEQHRLHPSWSYKLHADNVRAALEQKGSAVPSAATLRRWMQGQGLFKTTRCRGQNREAALAARDHIAAKEVRSFENEYVGGLWHLDFHHCSLQVVVAAGRWCTPKGVAVLDDYSRVACHVQWYLEETAKSLVHGTSQAFQRRGLPRALLSDNGSAMVSAEFTEGLRRLGVVHETTLPYSPYQNAKQERFFGVLEGRLVAMLEGRAELTLAELNDATSAWIEMEYNRAQHAELGDSPLNRFLNGKSVLRRSPGSDELRLAFRREVSRRQRRTDGTISLCGKRFELPGCYRHLVQVRVRYAEWDLRQVHLVDPRNGTVLCPLYPLDKAANASGVRRALTPPSTAPLPAQNDTPPLLQKLMADYAATGLPPAYVPFEEEEES